METNSQDSKEFNTGEDQDASIEEFRKTINDFLNENQSRKKGNRKLCFSCTKIFEKGKPFDSHSCNTQVVNKYFQWQCRICKKCFTKHMNLETHLHNLHGIGNKTKCTFCESEVYDMRKHERQFHNSKQSCPDCGKAVKNMKHHFQTIHGPADLKKFVCEICEKRFLLKEKLVAHSVVHSEERKFECKSKCGFA